MKKLLVPALFFVTFLIAGCSEEPMASEEPLKTVTADAVAIAEPAPARKNEEIKTVKLCHDTDNGIVRWVNGSVFGFYDNATRFEFNDHCQNFNYLKEFYCEEENPKERIFLCKNGCEDNHCL